MRIRICVAFLALGAVIPGASASGDPVKAGMDPQLLSRIPARLQSYVEKGVIAGAVTLVQRHGVVAALDAVGYQDLGAKKPMRADVIFMIMSMTKPVTATGIMMLVEDGKLALDDPVERHLPEFRGMWMIDGEAGEKTQRLKRPPRPITIRDLLTHTSGMPQYPPEGLSNLRRTLAEAVLVYSQLPLLFPPGSNYNYSNPGYATLGRIIEVVSDQPYERFLDEHIFKPLGMVDSFFYPPEDKKERLASVYRPMGGKLTKIAAPIAPYYDLAARSRPARADQKPGYPRPEAGMYSTAADLAAFYQCMLNGGAYKGKRILSKASVEVMTKSHSGDLIVQTGTEAEGRGISWRVTRSPRGTVNLSSIGTYGHAGSYNTTGWIDPQKDLITVYLVQGGGGERLSDLFRAMANSAIIE